MRRLILGAVALITGLLAAGGIAMARRRGDRDEILELDPAPPLGAGESGATTDASVEADFGPVGEPAEAEVAPEPKKRKPRVRRKPAKPAVDVDGAEGASGTTDETNDATIKAERNAEAAAKAEAAASAEAAAIAGATEGADAPVAS